MSRWPTICRGETDEICWNHQTVHHRNTWAKSMTSAETINSHIIDSFAQTQRNPLKPINRHSTIHLTKLEIIFWKITTPCIRGSSENSRRYLQKPVNHSSSIDCGYHQRSLVWSLSRLPQAHTSKIGYICRNHSLTDHRCFWVRSTKSAETINSTANARFEQYPRSRLESINQLSPQWWAKSKILVGCSKPHINDASEPEFKKIYEII